MTEKWQGQVADLEVEDSGGTEIPFGVIDEPEITVNSNVEELRGAGPVTWQDLMRTELSVDVTGTVMEWDLDLWKELVGYDEAQDQLQTGESVPTWTTNVIFTNNAGDTAEFPVVECYSESVTVGGSREEWIGMDFEFTGKTIEGLDAESTSTA